MGAQGQASRSLTGSRTRIWTMVEPGGLFIDLESMWDDYERTVESFLAMLRNDPERRRAAIEWWSTRHYTVQDVAAAATAMTFSASAANPEQLLPPT